MKKLKLVLSFILLCCLSPLLHAQSALILPSERWLLVDTTARTLSVMRGETTVEARFDYIALGRLGPKPVHYRGDTSTPTGEFHIDAINHQSNYTLFFRLNYPTVAHASLALAAGKITQQDHERIALAEWHGKPPPQDTPLGGMIGIHGIGRGSLKVHRDFNWTEGCVALDNQQIHALARYVRMGMRVIIRE